MHDSGDLPRTAPPTFDWAAAVEADAPDAAVILDAEFRIVWRTGSNERITGWSFAEVEGTSRHGSVDPADLGAMLEALELARSDPGRAVAVGFDFDTRFGWKRCEGWISDVSHIRPGHTMLRFREATPDTPGPPDGPRAPLDPFLQMANASTLGFALVGGRGNVLYRNARFEEWFPVDHVPSLAALAGLARPEHRDEALRWCAEAVGIAGADAESALPALTVELDGAHPGSRWITLEAGREDTGSAGTLIGITAQDVSDIVATRNSMRQMIDLVPLLVFAIDTDGRVQFTNRATGEFLGVDHRAVEGRLLPEVMGSELADELVAAARELIANGTSLENLADVVTAADGTERFLRTSLIPYTAEATGTPTLLAVSSDVTDETRNEALISALGRNMPDLAMVLDAHSHIAFVSDSVQSLLGWTPEEFTSQEPDDVVHDGDLLRLRTLHDPTVSEPGAVHTAEARLLHRDGTWRWFELRTVNLSHIASISGVLVFGRDTSERKEHESRLRHEATHDQLTTLLNRAAIIEALELALGRARTEGSPVGALFIDIDNFKMVNDGLGHDAGDSLLQTVGRVLHRCTRDADTIGRLGGDEFLLVVSEVDDEPALLEVATRVQEQVATETRGASLPVTLSIGACFSPRGETTAQAMVRTADAAMYRAKAAGKARTETFHSDVAEHAARRLDVGRLLDDALALGTFTVHFQPVFHREGGRWRLRALETLARCPLPDGGWLSPEEFVPVAEQTGMITRMGQRVATLTVRELARWHANGHPVNAWINLSMSELTQPGLHRSLAGALRRAGLPTSALGVEVTESVFGESLHQVTAALSGLREAGMTVLIDDFGTGYSSLAALKNYPIDIAKVDRVFCSGMLDSDADAAIVESVVRIGQVMGFEMVAEGVETPEQLAALAAVGCQNVQGWLFARAMPAAEVDDRLEEWMAGLVIGAGAVMPAPVAGR